MLSRLGRTLIFGVGPRPQSNRSQKKRNEQWYKERPPPVTVHEVCDDQYQKCGHEDSVTQFVCVKLE